MQLIADMNLVVYRIRASQLLFNELIIVILNILCDLLFQLFFSIIPNLFSKTSTLVLQILFKIYSNHSAVAGR